VSFIPTFPLLNKREMKENEWKKKRNRESYPTVSI
jgi:hypothetical protein